jgi:hypothetical protein
MVINGTVVNNTAGNDARCLPKETIQPTPFADPDQEGSAPVQGGTTIYLPAVRHCTPYERPVANGMMMVLYEPKNTSPTFAPGQMVVTPGESTVRLGPGTNYSAIGVVSPGTPGVIDPGHGLQGVQAKGYFWWKVDFGGAVGWVPEGDIVPVTAPDPTSTPDSVGIFLPSLPE